MDNIGIPMLWGNHDIDLDPSIARPYIMPPPNQIDSPRDGRFDWLKPRHAIDQRKTDKTLRFLQAGESGRASTSPMPPSPSTSARKSLPGDPNMRKIPESELEGITLPAPGTMDDDDKKNP
jgi:hypothetical protein